MLHPLANAVQRGFARRQGYAALRSRPMSNAVSTKEHGTARCAATVRFASSEVSIGEHVYGGRLLLPVVDIHQSREADKITTHPFDFRVGVSVWHCILPAQLFCRERDVRAVPGQVVGSGIHRPVHCRFIRAQGMRLRLSRFTALAPLRPWKLFLVGLVRAAYMSDAVISAFSY